MLDLTSVIIVSSATPPVVVTPLPPVIEAAPAPPSATAAAAPAIVLLPALGHVHPHGRVPVHQRAVKLQRLGETVAVVELDVAEALELVGVAVVHQAHAPHLQVLEDGVDVALDDVGGEVAHEGGVRRLLRQRPLASSAVASAPATVAATPASVTSPPATINIVNISTLSRYPNCKSKPRKYEPLTILVNCNI